MATSVTALWVHTGALEETQTGKPYTAPPYLNQSAWVLGQGCINAPCAALRMKKTSEVKHYLVGDAETVATNNLMYGKQKFFIL